MIFVRKIERHEVVSLPCGEIVIAVSSNSNSEKKPFYTKGLPNSSKRYGQLSVFDGERFLHPTEDEVLNLLSIPLSNAEIKIG